MNRFEGLPAHNFGFNSSAVKFMQDAYLALEKLTNLAGNCILEGCAVTSNDRIKQVSAGWIILNGELLYFAGGAINASEAGLRRKQTITEVQVEGAGGTGTRTEVRIEAELFAIVMSPELSEEQNYIQLYVFASNTGNWGLVNLQRFVETSVSTLTNRVNTAVSNINTLVGRIEALTSRVEALESRIGGGVIISEPQM
jgi:hypothetical protein